MASTALMLILIAEYMLIAVTAAAERNWPRSLYFTSATGISIAVLWMTAEKS